MDEPDRPDGRGRAGDGPVTPTGPEGEDSEPAGEGAGRDPGTSGPVGASGASGASDSVGASEGEPAGTGGTPTPQPREDTPLPITDDAGTTVIPTAPRTDEDPTLVVPLPAPPTEVGVPTEGSPAPPPTQAGPPPWSPYPAQPGPQAPWGATTVQPGPPAPPAPHPRPQHTGRWIAGLSAVIVLVLAVLGGGTWLLLGSLGPGIPDGFRVVETPYLTYAVPEGWTPVEGQSTSALGVTFAGGADAPAYTCRGDEYRRGLATSTLVSTTEDPATVARLFAAELGSQFYLVANRPPRVVLSDARPVGDGAVVEATSTTPADDGCLATRGTTFVLAVPVPGGGTAVLVANADATGGPAEPPSPDPQVLREIVDSAAVPG